MNASSKPRVGLLIGSTREGRLGELPAGWILALSREQSDFDLESVDLRDFPIPLFNEAAPPLARPVRAAVHLGRDELAAVSRGERSFGDYPHLADAAQRLVRHMGWWATLLSAHRHRDELHTPG